MLAIARGPVLSLALALVLALVLALAASGCAPDLDYRAAPGAAPKVGAAADRPAFAVGDEFWYDVGGGAIVVEVFDGVRDGLLAFRRPMANEVRYYSPDLALVRVDLAFGDDRWYEPDDGMLEFPLAVGRTWTRRFRALQSGEARSTQHTRTCAVVDSGEATVGADRLRVFRIECTLRELGSARAVEEELLYAPAVGRLVAHDTRHGGARMRLIEFTRAP